MTAIYKVLKTFDIRIVKIGCVGYGRISIVNILSNNKVITELDKPDYRIHIESEALTKTKLEVINNGR